MLTNTFIFHRNPIMTTPTKINRTEQKKKTPEIESSITTNQSSPVRKKRCPADHNRVTNYNPNSFKSYFTTTYYEKHPNCTRQCVSCKGLFGTDIKISAKSPVMCCTNTLHKTNPCTHAYCSPCYTKWQGYD